MPKTEAARTLPDPTRGEAARARAAEMLGRPFDPNHAETKAADAPQDQTKIADTATLVRGETYSLKQGDTFLRFKRGETKPVTAAQKAALKDAVDLRTDKCPVPDGAGGERDVVANRRLPKFRFASEQASEAASVS